MGDYTERVAAGAALLDEKRPGWWQRIDLSTLRMENGCACILGQEYAQDYADADCDGEADEMADGYEYACGVLIGWEAGYPPGEVHDLGFYDDERRWPELRAAWVALIEGRRATGTTP